MNYYKNILLLCIFYLILFACENSILKWDLPQLATVETSDPVKISNSSVRCSGSITKDGGSFIKERGICYSTERNPTIISNKVTSGTGKGTFTAVIDGLSPNTAYYFRAYAITNTGVSYGNETILANGVLPELKTNPAASITTTSAACSGSIINIGSSDITDRGICYSTSSNPQISDNKISSVNEVSDFSVNLNGLAPATTYFVRAYAVNSSGVSYGNEITFTTASVAVPTVSTVTVSAVTLNSAVSGGNVSNDGGNPIVERGICYSKSSNPTVSDNKITSGTGTGSYSITLTGLTQGTIYYVRAYARNSAGTAYGNEISFTTNTPLLPTVTTAAATSVTISSAVSGGTVTNDNGSPVTERGICFSTAVNPTISNTKILAGSGNGSFTATISGLTQGTTYHVRAYATNSAGTSYGNDISFTTTSPSLAVITTTAASSITNNSAVSGGNVTNDNGSPVTERGICFSTSSNPDISDNKIASGSGNGSFTANIFGLTHGTTYHVRAYATNSAGTSYGNDISFTTTSPSLAVITTTAASSITNNSAVSGGNVTNNNGSPVTERGICFSTSSNPDISDNKIASGSGNGSFIANISGLTQGTTYHVRAYATNSAGTSYGNDISFTTTSPSLAVITTTAASSITNNSAVSGGNVTNDNGSPVTERGICFSTAINPTVSNNKIPVGSGNGSFTATINGLNPGTTYHVRAYATNSAGTSYGNDISFATTSPSLSTVTTAAVSSITLNSAVSGGNVTADGGSPVTEKGICYSTSTNPTTSDNKITGGTGTGNFISNLTGLNSGTTYYVRAYAVTSAGTAYGNQVNFTTKPILLATISTSSATSITNTTAVTGGNVTNDGGGPISERGICYKTTPGPVISDNKIEGSTGTGVFSISLSGLSLGTTYYVRAYAINAAGTSYGNEISFTTSSILTIGTNYQGGIIFYLDNTGSHGLIAAPSDQSGEAKWGCSGTTIIGIETSIGTGLKNTAAIISTCNELSAARICYNLNLGSYTDWYLPSKDELDLMYVNLKSKDMGNFSSTDYWSSSQESDKNAWLHSFSTGRSSSKNKNTTMNVRAIRSF